MSDKTVLALRVMAGAAVMGILGDLLLRQFPWGLNIFLWLAALVATVAIIVKLQPSAGPRVNRWMLVPVVVFGAFFAWRASIPLKLMDVFAVLVAAALASPLAGRVRVPTLPWHVSAQKSRSASKGQVRNAACSLTAQNT